MRAFLFGVVVLVGGCQADPCDGMSGTCVSARVDGQPAILDQLRVSVDGQSAPMLTGSSFTLPVRVAIVFATPPGASASITVDGLVGGAVAGTSGKQSVPLTANGRTSYDFHLAPGAGDGGAGDGMPGDGSPGDGPPPNVVSFTPSTFTFPDTPRGTKQATLATITVVNSTSKTVTATAMTSTGDMGSYHFEPSSTCPMSMGPAPFPAGATCTLVVSFTPDAAGPLQQTNMLTFDDGEMLSLVFNGNGLRAWSAETPTGATTSFEAVWASSPTDWWGVGHDSGCAVWHSTGNGQWAQMCGGGAVTTHNFFSVNGTGSGDVWLGGDNGDLWHYNGNTFNQQSPAPAGRFVRGIIAFTAADAMAIDSNGAAYCLSGINFVVCNPPTPMSFTATCLTGTADYTWAGGTMSNILFHQPGISGWGFYTKPFSGSIANMDVSGIWVAPNANQDVFAVGAVGGNTLAIFHTSNATGPTGESPPTAQGGLLAVAGRKDPTGVLDVYAVGGIGTQVLHSTGNGQWAQLQVPGGTGLTNRGVWVASDGQVVVVGDNAQILHYW